MKIGIIGGGASGMCAALAAAQNPNAQVHIFERQARVGRKLMATGNGRCNLTNIHVDVSHYHGDAPEFCSAALNAVSSEKTVAWFRSLGLYTVTENSGRVYPYSDQANSVVDVLRFALSKPNISLHTGCEVQRIRKTEGRFTVTAGEESFDFDKLIIACGGLAGSKLGGSMSGYQLLKQMGHHITQLRPALVQIKSGWNGCVSLKGVRANCHAAICCDGVVFRDGTGELQFTEYGISGPVIFEISRDACRGKGNWICLLDFLPEMSENKLLEELTRRRYTELPTEELLIGILHNRLGRVLTSAAGIRAQRDVKSLTDEELNDVCRIVKSLELPLTELMGMDNAQVTAGGAVTAEFDPNTMESRLMPGLYACGEVLDVDGDCGGYNLQWAWSSGMVAGCSAGEVTL